ncbi:chemotaxis protein CheW [Roseateles cavernae]|uniref:chemotaxis protein CheW n=1 Tax=Roseateles cavernae TaxID=3153578 RepID=UPI0032E3DEF4
MTMNGTPPVGAPDDAVCRVLAFTACGDTFAVERHHVRQIDLCDPSVPVLDLGEWLMGQSASPGELLMLETHGQLLILRVQRVLGEVSLPRKQIQTLNQGVRRHVVDAIAHNGRMSIAIVSPDRLMTAAHAGNHRIDTPSQSWSPQ